MNYQKVFLRYEMKYILDEDEELRIKELISPYMSLDAYGKSEIRNIDLDTPDYRLITRSLEKPEYKEKIRIRSYGRVDTDTPAFVELKKKYKGIVYKRRMMLPESTACDWLCTDSARPVDSQIAREIDYFKSFYYPLSKTVFLSYDREAYYSDSLQGFRVTFDRNIRSRCENITLSGDTDGEPVLSPDLTLMEIKCLGGIPLFMANILSSNKIYKMSFSKYGTAYQKYIFPKRSIAYV